MKRLLIVTLAVLCLCLSACGKNTEAADDWGITLEVHNPTPTGLELICTHQGETGGELPFTGEEYRLEIRKNGKWQAVPYAVEGDVDWNAIGILIEENGTTILPHDWEYLYGALPTGTYRICKEFLRGTGDLLQRQMFYAEFTLP